MSTETPLSDQEQMTLMTSALNNLGRLLCRIRSVTTPGDGPITAETQIHLCQLADALHNVPDIIVQCLIEKTNNVATDNWAQFELKRSLVASLNSVNQHNGFDLAQFGAPAVENQQPDSAEVQA